jgi:hypothetical protein
MAPCCDTYTNFSGVQLQVLANQPITFYIVRPLFLKIVAMRQTILKIKEGLAYLSLGLIYHLKGYSQKPFHEHVPLRVIELGDYQSACLIKYTGNVTCIRTFAYNGRALQKRASYREILCRNSNPHSAYYHSLAHVEQDQYYNTVRINTRRGGV